MNITFVILAISLFIICVAQGLLIHIFFKQSVDTNRILDKAHERLENIDKLLEKLINHYSAANKRKEKIKKGKSVLRG